MNSHRVITSDARFRFGNDSTLAWNQNRKCSQTFRGFLEWESSFTIYIGIGIGDKSLHTFNHTGQFFYLLLHKTVVLLIHVLSWVLPLWAIEPGSLVMMFSKWDILRLPFPPLKPPFPLACKTMLGEMWFLGGSIWCFSKSHPQISSQFSNPEEKWLPTYKV